MKIYLSDKFLLVWRIIFYTIAAIFALLGHSNMTVVYENGKLLNSDLIRTLAFTLLIPANCASILVIRREIFKLKKRPNRDAGNELPEKLSNLLD